MATPENRMAKSSKSRSQADIDISMPGGKQKASWTATIVIWVTVLSAVFAMFYLEMPVLWVFGMLVIAFVGVFGGWIAWYAIVRRGTLTWMRLAYQPAKCFARGDIAGAEAALVRAIERANRFPPGSQPRGMMLEAIAEYLGNQGRSKEARAAFDECIETLERYVKSSPMDYFVALNNYAVFLLYHKEYEASQRILERVLDLALATKKRNDGVVTVTDAQLLLIQFILHINLVCIFLEMEEIAAMRYHLRGAEGFFNALPKGPRKQFQDHFLALRARCLFERRKVDAAWDMLEDALDPHHMNILRIRGRLHLHEGEYAEAESYFAHYEAEQSKICVAHHPQHLELRVYLAECQYHLGKFDAAFASIEKARSLIADFALPRDERWREKLQPWHDRAVQHGKMELANAIAEELRRTLTANETAVVVLERFRGQMHVPE
jgi:tetratricopeptide (TPR) repeat protein